MHGELFQNYIGCDASYAHMQWYTCHKSI